MILNEARTQEAKSIVRRCIGSKGIWASPYRYKYQCWTRDFVMAVEDALLNDGQLEPVKTHLSQLSVRQKSNGQIPIMYLNNVQWWLWIKIRNSIREKRMSFLLKAFFSREGVASLSPWTRDSEILFILGVLKYVDKTGDKDFLTSLKPNIELALEYVETTLMQDGLVRGADWRDTRPDLDDKFILTNNCFLYQVYTMLGSRKNAETLKEKLNKQFWTGTYYRDYPGTDEWDTLGNALAILLDIAPAEYAASIFKRAEQLDTPFGYKLSSVTLPPKNNREVELMKRINQFGVIWPFIHGFMILAAAKSGMHDLARQQFTKWNKVKGFYEWYDSVEGEGFGSNEQLWSAALYLRVTQAINQVRN